MTKIIDNFLKKLKTDRNTFATYILTWISIYIVVDRLVEILVMIFTGMSISYWGPIKYTLAMACPVFALAFALESDLVKSEKSKIPLVYLFIIGFYIIVLSMFTQWINISAWILFLSVPNYVEIVTEFSDLVKPAFTALALYLPVITVIPLINKIILGIDDNGDMVKSMEKSQGISLAPKKTEGRGAYSCEMFLLYDKETGKKVTLIESKRFLPMLVCGGSGTGKSSLVFEPMIARDIEKKYFFREVSKEMGYTALKTGIATLNCPYGNDYINANFNLNMLTPVIGKEAVYKVYMKKLILSNMNNNFTYKNLGITCISPDNEIILNMVNVCNNYKIEYNLIDPSDSNSIGLNPFVYKDASKVAVVISSVLKGMYATAHEDRDDLYNEDASMQAIENLVILLKEIYPKMNEGALPNLEDLLKLLTNFDLVEKMCKIMEAEDRLAEKYEMQLEYFKRCFYKDAPLKESTNKLLLASITQLDNLLRIQGVRSILCNRYNNINFDNMLEEGQVTFVCTRRGDLGATSHKAFGLFFLLAMQNSVLSRPGVESSRVPNFLYVDEFPDFMCKATESMFTMYRKYKVGTVISAQTLSQLEKTGTTHNYKDIIIANCSNKILTGGVSPEESEWWEKEFASKREWKYSVSMDGAKSEYNSTLSGVNYGVSSNVKAGEIMLFSLKKVAYKIQTDKNPECGVASLNFLSSKYKEPKKVKEYNFTSYNKDEEGSSKRNKFNIKNMNFMDKNKNEFDPVQTDTTDSDYHFDNNDPISTTSKK